MFVTRLISGIVLVVLAFLIVSKGGFLLYGVTCAISLIGMYELYRVIGVEKKGMGIAGYLACLAYYGIVWFHLDSYVNLLVIAALMVMMIIFVVTFPKYEVEQIAVSFLGITYLGIMISYLYQTRSMPDGKYLVWLIFLSSWGADTCAYCAGMLFGKHKCAPVLSPKKTWEGVVGGVVGPAILGFIYATVFKKNMLEIHNPAFVCAVGCAIAAVISMFGDLTASGLKRKHGVKDYGNLIPGHGGVLDRFDSMIFTAPAIFFVVQMLQR